MYTQFSILSPFPLLYFFSYLSRKYEDPELVLNQGGDNARELFKRLWHSARFAFRFTWLATALVFLLIFLIFLFSFSFLHCVEKGDGYLFFSQDIWKKSLESSLSIISGPLSIVGIDIL